MINTKELFLAVLATVVYFCVLWMVPWDSFTPSLWSISFSYIFDLIFFLTIFALYKNKNFLGRFNFHGASLRLLLTIILGVLCNSIIKNSEPLVSPFGYIQNIVVQLLIMAPIFEELVFRGGIYKLFEKAIENSLYRTIINSALFSFSHGFAFFLLPEEFHNFIYFQMGYTFLLGWICTKSRERSVGIVEPIFLHFVFNLIFYLYLN